MFGKSIRKIRAVGALLVFASLVIVPGSANAAAPSITSAEVFGNWKPEVVPAPTNMGPKTLFANSRPFGLRYEHGTLFVRGNATGDADGDGKLRLFIDVVVEDVDGNQATRTVTVQSVDDPDIGRAQGDFNAELTVTELGQHVANGTDSTTGDPADWGGSVLDVSITPRTVGGLEGTAWTDSITKYAGTPNDVTPPAINKISWPPAHWCHLSSVGMQTPGFLGPFGGQHLGGTREGDCGELSMDGFGAIPDATWVACVNFTPGYDYQNMNPLRTAQMCRTSPNNSINIGHAKVSGVIEDLPTNALGVGSEILSLKIEVLQGATVVMTKDVLSPRDGTTAGYSVAWNINWLAPNAYPQGEYDPYVFKVTACDAWQQCTVRTSHEIWVYPY